LLNAPAVTEGGQETAMSPPPLPENPEEPTHLTPMEPPPMPPMLDTSLAPPPLPPASPALPPPIQPPPMLQGGYNTPPVGTESQIGLWALIVGIVSIPTCCLPAGIVAIVLGKKAKADPLANQGLASAGFVLGIVSTILSALYYIFLGVMIVVGIMSGKH